MFWKMFQTVKKGIPVVLQVTTSGLKVLDENERVSNLSRIVLKYVLFT